MKLNLNDWVYECGVLMWYIASLEQRTLFLLIILFPSLFEVSTCQHTQSPNDVQRSRKTNNCYLIVLRPPTIKPDSTYQLPFCNGTYQISSQSIRFLPLQQLKTKQNSLRWRFGFFLEILNN